MPTFDPDQLPGLIGTWTFDRTDDNAYPATQKDLPAIPAAESTLELGLRGQALRLNKKGVVLPLKLKDLLKQNFTVSFWTRAEADPDGTILDANLVWGFSLDFVQGALRINALEKWFGGGTHNASMLSDWTQIALSYDGQYFTVYRDGAELVKLPTTKAPVFNDVINLGGNGYSGWIDDLRIYNQSLDAVTVRKIWLRR